LPELEPCDGSDSEEFEYVTLAASKLKAREVQLKDLERNSAKTRDLERLVPKPAVVVVNINGKPVRALVDSGSLADFISTTMVDQLHHDREAGKATWGTVSGVWFSFQGESFGNSEVTISGGG
jgi:hypothetical protein